MVAIWDWDDIPAVENTITDAFDIVKNTVIERSNISEYAERIELERTFVVGAWANGDAEPKETPLKLLLFLSVRGSNSYDTDEEFGHFARNILPTGIEDVINKGQEIDVPEEFEDNISEVNATAGPYNRLPDVANRAIIQSHGDKAFDLTRAELITRTEGTKYQNYPRQSLESLGKEEKEPESEEEQETEKEEDEEPTEERLQEEQAELEEEEPFPDVPEPLRQYAKSNEKLEITVGNKDTKTVSPRAPYDFEIIMATDRPNPNALDFKAPTEMVGDVMPGIGQAYRRNLFSREPGVEITRPIMPPATFPRTGAYIRNYLKFRGPAYALKMFNDHLIYLGYINSIYDYKLRTGTYRSFREYIYVLKEIPERGGPELIRSLSQQKAAAHGLKTIPDHPKIPGEKAPWLERRKYYELVEENEDHELWHDAYSFFKSDDDETDENGAV